MNKLVHVFWCDEVGAGGISTNIIALAQYVEISGSRPLIVSVKKIKSPIVNICNKFVDFLSPVALFARMYRSNNEDYVFFVNSVRTLLISYFLFILFNFKGIKAKIVFAVYNPWEFCGNGLWQNSYRSMVMSLGSGNVYFMNGACLQHHQISAKNFKFANQFLPLVKPNIQTPDLKESSKSVCTVLTVGRFVGFKMHYLRQLVLYAITKPELVFNIVGYGEGDSELKQLAIENDAHNVNFLGMLDYEALAKLYASASCYVGMGTTLVEASSYGTPSIVAIAGLAGNLSYGYFKDQDQYDMGEFRPGKEFCSLSLVLDDFFKSDFEERKELSHLHHLFSERFSVDKVGFVYSQLIDGSSFNLIGLKELYCISKFSVFTLFYFIFWKLRGKKSRYDVPYII